MKTVDIMPTIDLAYAAAATFAADARMTAMPRRLSRDSIERAFGKAQTNNEWLIFCCHATTDERRPRRASPAPAKHTRKAALRRQIPGFGHGGRAAARRHLNAFFAISVNSPPMSMVNFSCCVCSALTSCACGVTRRVTPQPMRAAVRMEAGAHACL
jgi:hypothetical protein